MITPETHAEYVKRIGAPRVVPCAIDLGSGSPLHGIWICHSHGYEFNDRPDALRGMSDRCPMSRLEEWRQRRWDGDAQTPRERAAAARARYEALAGPVRRYGPQDFGL